MSILSVLQEYLKEFDGMELRPISEVLTDRPEGPASAYAVAPAGNGQTSQDVTGRRFYRNSYVFYAQELAGAEADRAENWDFLETLTAWLEQRADAQDFPKLPAPYTVEGLEVSNAMLIDINDHGYGTYQVQIQLEFSKE